ncbi:MAG TPA: carboxypeptidase-like regulatory domain-containing protein [Puia sp.]|nr:carboxypeptidase-like regulatory domain-containing protein [Puia sp.]
MISVEVFEAGTGKPIAGATVMAADIFYKPTGSPETTNEKGIFQLEEAGAAQVIIRAEGYKMRILPLQKLPPVITIEPAPSKPEKELLQAKNRIKKIGKYQKWYYAGVAGIILTASYVIYRQVN